MSGRNVDRGSANRGAKRKAPRASAGGDGAEAPLGTGGSPSAGSELEELYVDDRPQKPKKNGHNGHLSGASERKPAAARSSTKRPVASPSSSPKKGHRAAERRRARGEVPLGPEAGTNTALNQPGGAGASGESGQLKYAVGVLTCVKGPEEGLALNLLEGSYTVGRGRDNSFVLKDIASSRRHLRIDVEGQRVSVSDLGSGNGTRVNGKNITTVALDEGDRVELGNSVLLFSRANERSLRKASASASLPSPDDAKARIERAAEQLAAELGERFRDGGGAPPGGDDAAPTSMERPRAPGKREDEAPKPRPPMPDELWNDALTHVPLSEVVPADAPLGQSQREASQGSRADRSARPPATPFGPPPTTPPPTSPRVPEVRPRAVTPPPPEVRPRLATPQSRPAAKPPPLLDIDVDVEPIAPALSTPPVPLPPRPPPATVPPQPAAPAHGVMAERPPPSAWTYVLLPAIIVVLVLGTALGGWALYRYVRASEPPRVTSAEYEQAVRSASQALDAKDLDTALLHAQRAFELRPDEVSVEVLLKTIQEARAEAAAAEAQAAAAKVAPPAEEPPPAAAAVEEPPPESSPEPEAVVAKESPPPSRAAAQKPAPAVRRQRPRPRPSPAARRQQQARRMSDDDAGKAFRQAVRLIRDEDEARACALFRRVASSAPASSNWKVKASGAVSRYGCD